MTGLPAFHLRTPEPGDVESIARVHIASWRTTYGHLLPESFFDDRALERRRTQWRAIVNKPERVQIAEAEGQVIGFAHAGRPFDDHPVRDLQLYAIYLLTEHHGRGAGQELLDAVLGQDSAQLWVARDNVRAQRFYRRNGFSPDGIERTDPATSNLVGLRFVR